jgi:sterol desaturase/sphingolipid hydroxylase (fatty acid hydroxylase superfamily)
METIIAILLPASFLVLLVIERLFPARPLPKIRWWLLKGFLFFIVGGVINTLIPGIVAAVAGRFAPVHLDKLGLLPNMILLLGLGELTAYWMHRGLHRVHFIWKWTHQMHHSAERLDVAGSVYFHPFDIAIQAAAGTLPAALLGASGDAAALVGLIAFVLSMFQHLNVKTPQWLGYIVQRPEGHSVHHARGVHAYNYGLFAFSDLLFGTFRNPKDFAPEAGFWDGASTKIGAMLIGRDVGEPAPRKKAEPALAMSEAAAE